MVTYEQFHNPHDRSLSTGHANSARDMIGRLETMVLGAADLPVGVVRHSIGSAIDVIVHLMRLRDRSRRVVEIAEITGCDEGEVMLHPLFEFEERGEKDGAVVGRLVRRGELQHREKLDRAGVKLSELPG